MKFFLVCRGVHNTDNREKKYVKEFVATRRKSHNVNKEGEKYGNREIFRAKNSLPCTK